MVEAVEGVTIEELPAAAPAVPSHLFAAMKDGLTVKLSLTQLIELFSTEVGFVPEGGGIMTGNLEIEVSDARIILDKVNGSPSGIVWQTGGGNRWTLFSSSDGESGDTAGSLFKLVSYTVAGVPTEVFTVSRAGGILDFKTAPTVLGQPLVVDVEPRLGADWDIRLNPNVINQSLVIPTGMNGMTAGPVEIASGFTVEVSSGSTWTVV